MAADPSTHQVLTLPETHAEKLLLEARLAEYNTLRAEILARSQFQHNLLQIHYLTIVGVLTFSIASLTSGSASISPGRITFLIIGITSALLGFLAVSHDIVITDVGNQILKQEISINNVVNQKAISWEIDNAWRNPYKGGAVGVLFLMGFYFLTTLQFWAPSLISVWIGHLLWWSKWRVSSPTDPEAPLANLAMTIIGFSWLCLAMFFLVSAVSIWKHHDAGLRRTGAKRSQLKLSEISRNVVRADVLVGLITNLDKGTEFRGVSVTADAERSERGQLTYVGRSFAYVDFVPAGGQSQFLMTIPALSDAATDRVSFSVFVMDQSRTDHDSGPQILRSLWKALSGRQFGRPAGTGDR